MRFLRKCLALAFVAVLLVTAPFAQAHAIGAYHPPALNFVVYGAPKDLQIILHITKEEGSCTVTLEPERRLWESYYRFYREAAWEISRWYGNSYDFQDTEIELKSGGVSTFIPMPNELLSERELNDFLTLSYRSGVISRGLPAWRTPLLIAMRLLALLAVKAIVFRLFDFRSRKSWLIFLITNLATLSIQTLYSSGWINVNPSKYALYYLLCFVMVVVEFVVMFLLVDENSRNRTANYTIWGNVAGETANFALFTLLPL